MFLSLIFLVRCFNKQLTIGSFTKNTSKNTKKRHQTQKMLAFAHYLEYQKTLKLWTLRILKYFREAKERERERDPLEAEVSLKLKTSH